MSAGLVVRQASFPSDEASIRAVRFAVFVDEQHVPAELEMDDRDAECLHVLALSGATAVATARLDLGLGGKIGRMAVIAPFRRRGLGRHMLDELHRAAHAAGCTEVWCNAQVAAMAFYERAGYVAEGPRFDEAGIEHVKMRCALQNVR
jgi:predicted GNAT family N-acyltransferase